MSNRKRKAKRQPKPRWMRSSRSGAYTDESHCGRIERMAQQVLQGLAQGQITRADVDYMARPNAKPQPASDMCSSCAFNDPTAWTDDPALGAKLKLCIETGLPFICHEFGVGAQLVGTTLKYIPPLRVDGTVALEQTRLGRGFQDALERRAAASGANGTPA